MPSEVELRLVEEGLRSSLYVSAGGELYRWYADTDTWEGPLPTLRDASGEQRYGSNRKVSRLVDEAFSAVYRGAGGTKKKARPEHMQHAFREMLQGPEDIHAFAARCGSIAESTAWAYAGGVVERWPQTHVMARALVHPALLDALAELDRAGPLRTVLARLDDSPLCYDPTWRRMPESERFCHLRLARLCLDAEETI